MTTLINILLQEIPAATNIFDILGGGAGGAGGGVITYLITKHLIEKKEPKVEDLIESSEKELKSQLIHDKNGNKAANVALDNKIEKIVENMGNKISREQYDKEYQWLKDEISDQKKDHDKDIAELKTDIKELSTRVDTGFNEIKNLLINR